MNNIKLNRKNDFKESKMAKEKVTKVKKLKTTIEELNQASALISGADLTSMVPTKFGVRRDKIVTELNSFIEVLQRKSTVIEKKVSKIVALRAELMKLEQENQ
jgi:hypothetical protein